MIKNLIKSLYSKFYILNSNRKGFTLIELLIVIAIIGMLASVVLIGMGGMRQRSRDARRITDLKQVQNALELYYTKNNRYPADTVWGNSSINPSLTYSLINAGIGVTSIPNDPLGSPNTYGYASPAGNQNYVLQAKFEDSTNPALNEDGNGTRVLGTSIDCNGNYYCVQF